MRTIEEVTYQFGYHPATPDSARDHDALRTAYTALAANVWDLIPNGPEKTTAMRKLQESLMYANLAVALQVPVDAVTAAVARVLPADA